MGRNDMAVAFADRPGLPLLDPATAAAGLAPKPYVTAQTDAAPRAQR
jgi:hypothetical protein